MPPQLARRHSVESQELKSKGQVTDMGSYPMHVNHELSPMTCPVTLDDVDLFGRYVE